jgi:hypothetical protein
MQALSTWAPLNWSLLRTLKEHLAGRDSKNQVRGSTLPSSASRAAEAEASGATASVMLTVCTF